VTARDPIRLDLSALGLDDAIAQIDIVFFDCDGVIFDVNAAKSAAFDYAVADYPAPARQALVAYHQQSGGISRYAKLRRFFTEICPVDDVEPAVEEALERFGAFSRRAYDDLHPRPQALRFAENVQAASRGYVVSGADQAELRSIFDAKAITHHFVEVLGSPADKPTHVRRVLADRGLPPSRALFIGDGRGDFDCADEIGLWFVFLREMSDWVDGREVVEGARGRFAKRGVASAVAKSWAALETALAKA
jgi:phosphoglycolate phosphatase-like HAD superfamily hydrolase